MDRGLEMGYLAYGVGLLLFIFPPALRAVSCVYIL